jgi:hypothetical protein
MPSRYPRPPLSPRAARPRVRGRHPRRRRPELPAVVRARAVGVLLERDEPQAGRELDDHLRRSAEIDALDDRPRQLHHPIFEELVERDLLGADRELHGAPVRARRRHGGRAQRPAGEPHGAALDRAREKVRDPDEAGDERSLGLLVDLLRRAALDDHAVVHHGDAVEDRQRLLLVVRHVHGRDPDLALDRLELDLHLLAQLEVERAERLVEQQHGRVDDERAGQRDALLHAAGQLARAGLLAPAQADQLERLADAPPDLGLGDLAPREADATLRCRSRCSKSA